MSDFRKSPGLTIPPPFYYILALLSGMGLDYLYPVGMELSGLSLYLGWSLIVLSLVIVISAMVQFKRADTPFDVRQGASALVTNGVMTLSRNPGYLALSLLYLGLAILLSNTWMLYFVVPVLLVMDRYVIRREEMHLEQLFGGEYLAYKARVRRWI